MIERLALWLARKLAARYGWAVVRATPLALLPSRVAAVEQRIRTSGHIARVYAVRGKLERDIRAVQEQVSLLDGGAA